LFKIFGIRLPSRVEQGSFDERVRPLVEADPDLAHALLPLLDARAVLYTTYRELDRRVKQAASRDEDCMRFMAIPGVGPIAALTFRANSKRIEAIEQVEEAGNTCLFLCSITQ